VPKNHNESMALDIAVGSVPPGSQRQAADAVALLRELAGTGLLATSVREVPARQRSALVAAAYAVAWPVVFQRLTRVMERRRGHHACASSVHRLADECLDRFEDDVEAVVDDLLTHADRPIRVLEAWIASRLTAATVNGHRRARGSRGALQRPRLPRWLSDGLGHDPWLEDLALQILTWVGVPAAAGTQLWPLGSWAQRRAAVTGDWAGCDQVVVQRDVDRVLSVMATRHKWYADHVERPLGHKHVPVAAALSTSDGCHPELAPLLLTHPHQLDDARLCGLADDAVLTIQERLRRGEDAHRVVVEVISVVFGALPAGNEIDQPPHAAPGYDERVSVLLGNPSDRARIVRNVLGVVS
jgi:hypothetical protein